MSVTQIVTAIIEALTQFVTGFATALVSAAESIFFVGEGDAAKLSALGIVLMVAVGLGIAYWVIDKVISLFRIRRG